MPKWNGVNRISRFLVAIMAAVFFVGQAHGQALVVPKEVMAPQGKITLIECKYEGKALDWRFLGPGKCFREHSDDPKVVRFQVLAQGQCYLTVAAVGEDGKLYLSECLILGVPGPGPDPKPDPKPPSDLKLKLKAAYEADKGSPLAKKTQLLHLIGGYSAFADHAAGPSMKTVAHLRADLEACLAGMLKDGLVDVRKLVGSELASIVGTSASAEITETQRAQVVSTMRAIVSALEWMGGQ